MSFWARLLRRASMAPTVTLIESGKVTRERATWAEIERAIQKYFPGDDWYVFDLRFGNFDERRFMVVSSKTNGADLFAVLVTFDGETYFSPMPEVCQATYSRRSWDVYPDDRCVYISTARLVARTFCERGELDPRVDWLSFHGTGYVGRPS
jgi:hypothetical protein